MSKQYTFNKEDGGKIFRGAVIACGGALLVYLADVVPQVDFGAYTALAVAMASVLINAGRRYFAEL